MKKSAKYFLAHAAARRLTLFSGSVLGACFLMGPQAAKAQYQFITGFGTSEIPAYPAAPAAFTAGTPVNSSTSAIAFGGANGNSEGWTASSSSSAGALVTVAASGSFTGGQALTSTTTSPGSGTTYIGALQVSDLYGGVGIESLQFDASVTADSSASFATLGGWYDGESNGEFVQDTGTGVVGGILSGGDFGIRAANFGNSYSSGVLATPGDWYQITLTYDYAANSAMLAAYNLTTDAAVNLEGVGGDYVETISGLYSSANPSAYEGVVARVTGTGELTDLYVQPVPEPGIMSITAVGFGCLLVGLRRRP